MTLTIIVVLFSTVCFFGSFAHSDGGEGFIVNSLAKLFYVFAFPFLYIFYLLNIINGVSYIEALILDSLFYGLLIERIIFISKTKKGVK